MNRKEFVSQLGLGIAGFAFLSCTQGCSKKSVAAAPENVNYTLNLSETAYAPLLNTGGYIYYKGLIIGKALSGDYLAVSQACTHEGENVVFESNTTKTQFVCRAHNSYFSSEGTVTGGPAKSSLKKYTVSATGSGTATVLTIKG